MKAPYLKLAGIFAVAVAFLFIFSNSRPPNISAQEDCSSDDIDCFHYICSGLSCIYMMGPGVSTCTVGGTDCLPKCNGNSSCGVGGSGAVCRGKEDCEVPPDGCSGTECVPGGVGDCSGGCGVVWGCSGGVCAENGGGGPCPCGPPPSKCSGSSCVPGGSGKSCSSPADCIIARCVDSVCTVGAETGEPCDSSYPANLTSCDWGCSSSSCIRGGKEGYCGTGEDGQTSDSSKCEMGHCAFDPTSGRPWCAPGEETGKDSCNLSRSSTSCIFGCQGEQCVREGSEGSCASSTNANEPDQQKCENYCNLNGACVKNGNSGQRCNTLGNSDPLCLPRCSDSMCVVGGSSKILCDIQYMNTILDPKCKPHCNEDSTGVKSCMMGGNTSTICSSVPNDPICGPHATCSSDRKCEVGGNTDIQCDDVGSMNDPACKSYCDKDPSTGATSCKVGGNVKSKECLSIGENPNCGPSFCSNDGTCKLGGKGGLPCETGESGNNFCAWKCTSDKKCVQGTTGGERCVMGLPSLCCTIPGAHCPPDTNCSGFKCQEPSPPFMPHCLTIPYSQGLSDAGLAKFTWTYGDCTGMTTAECVASAPAETGFELQISEDSKFDNLVVYDTVNFDSNSSLPPGSPNTQLIPIRIEEALPAPALIPFGAEWIDPKSDEVNPPRTDWLNFKTKYYWKVRTIAGTGNYSDWAVSSSRFESEYDHPAPNVSFSVPNNLILSGEEVTFNDASICYTPTDYYSCKDTNPDEHSDVNTYEWNFGDGSDVVTTTRTAVISHVFTASSTVTLTICDKIGCSAPLSRTIIVNNYYNLPNWKEVSPYE